MSIWLMPAPEHFEAFFFRCDDERGLGRVIDALRPLRVNSTPRSAVHIGNDCKVLNGIQQYPWEETGGTTPLLPRHMAALRARLRIGRWNGSRDPTIAVSRAAPCGSMGRTRAPRPRQAGA